MHSAPRSRLLGVRPALSLLLGSIGFEAVSSAQCAPLTVPPPIPGVPLIDQAIQAQIAAGCPQPFVLNLSPGVYNEQVVIPAGVDLVLNGALPFGSTSLDGTGLPGSVLTFSGGQSNGTLVQNLFIVNGTAFQGGGILAMADARPTLRNLTIVNCSAQFGGGIFVDSNTTGAFPFQTLKLTRVILRSNHADFSGGGLAVVGTGSPFGADDVLIRLSEFKANTAGTPVSGGTGAGGGISTQGGAFVHVDHSLLLANTADLQGGAIAVRQSGCLRVSQCVLEQNRATGLGATSDYGGGGVSVAFGDQVSVVDSVFRENFGDETIGTLPFTSFGGHVLVVSGSEVLASTYVLRNNLFLEGKAANGGALAILSDAPTDVLLSTFSGNSATRGGAIYSAAAGTTLAPRIVDTIAYADFGNQADPLTTSFEIYSPNVTPSVSFSDVEHPGTGLYPGLSMRNRHPGWLAGYACSYAPDAGFFLPQSALNQCFDKGSSSAYPEIVAGFSTDTNGNADTGPVDIGYHHPPRTCP